MSDLNKTNEHHIILFYKYLELDEPYSIEIEQANLCQQLNLLGRILLSHEGINATLSGSLESINTYVEYMCKHNVFEMTEDDFKRSSLMLSGDKPCPFPKLAIRVVEEIVSTGHTVARPTTKEADRGYLTPHEFHEAIKNSSVEDTVILDVRNHKEYLVGHFDNALDPEVRTFSEYYNYLNKKDPLLQNKKVLMYCTGGIRCEKASIFLRSKGYNEVYHLKGGIHKYLEAYPSGGYFKGKNFVFDKRVVMGSNDKDIVGKCIECQIPYDEFMGKNVCTVCRDLILVCPSCVDKLHGEFHCDDHQYLKKCYFTFLQYFTIDELTEQQKELKHILNVKEKDSQWTKNKRRTIRKQIEKINTRIKQLSSSLCNVEIRQGNHCRTCGTLGCQGNCWGFWTETETENGNTIEY